MPSIEENTKSKLPEPENTNAMTGDTGIISQEDRDAVYAEQLRAWRQSVAASAPATGEIDVSSFVKAQSDFIKAQTAFLTSPKSEDKVVQYSIAQGKFIEAQNAVLEQLGVV